MVGEVQGDLHGWPSDDHLLKARGPASKDAGLFLFSPFATRWVA
jgi:hypothetical protein